MESIKIENFEKSHPGISFPWYRSLDSDSCWQLRERLRERMQLPSGVSCLDLVQAIYQRSAVVIVADTKSADFDFAAIMQTVGIVPTEHVFINWYRFDRVDELAFPDVSRYFEDIWYSKADDIDIFDNSLGWVVVICHYGEFRLVQFATSPGR